MGASLTTSDVPCVWIEPASLFSANVALPTVHPVSQDWVVFA